MPSDWVGRTLSKVILLKQIGRGGMAEVYLGHHTTLERQVAVKILHSHLLAEGNLPERFHAEAQAVATLRHPYIVQVFDFDLAEERPYIIMELIDGIPLDQYLHDLHASGRRMPPETVARLVMCLAAALDYAHARGIIHRDVKPGNVMLRREPGAGGSLPGSRLDPLAPLPVEVEPVLLDFGVARFTNTARLTLAGSVTGTPAYISPEQARGDPLDARTDIYSLGVMLYEMLAGRLPFEVSDTSPLAVLFKHISEPPLSVDGLHPEIQAVLDRALAKNPAERYERAGELAASLMSAVFGRPAVQASAAAASLPPLAGLVEALTLLCDQANAYAAALPASNYPARAAVSNLGDLARQALNEARDLAAALEAPLAPAAHPFSPRELQALTLVAQGLTNKEIAYRLQISERTVQFHLNSIFNKTGASSRTEAVALALQKGWLPKA